MWLQTIYFSSSKCLIACSGSRHKHKHHQGWKSERKEENCFILLLLPPCICCKKKKTCLAISIGIRSSASNNTKKTLVRKWMQSNAATQHFNNQVFSSTKLRGRCPFSFQVWHCATPTFSAVSLLICPAVISAELCPTWESLLQWDKTGDYRQQRWWHRATIWWQDSFPTATMSPASPRHLQDYQNKPEGTSVCVCTGTSTCGLLSPVVSSARWIDRTVTEQNGVCVCGSA